MERRSKRESLLRWRVLLAILCLSLGFVVAACGGDDEGGGDAAAPAEKVDIAAELKKPGDADGLGLDAGYRGGREDVREGVSEHHGQARRTSARATPHYRKVRTVLQSGKGLPDLIQMEFQYIPSFTHHRGPAGPDALPAGRLPRRVPRVGREADQPRRRDLRRAVGHRPARLHLPQGPARQGRHHRAAQDVGRVRRRRRASTTRRTRSPTWPTCPATQTGQWLGLFWQNGARPFSGTAENLTINLTDPKIKEVTEFWDPLIAGRRHLHGRGLHRRLVPGARQRQVRRLGLRGLGAGLPAGHGGQDLGQVARAAAAAVERGRQHVGQLGRLHARRAQEHEDPRCTRPSWPAGS